MAPTPADKTVYVDKLAAEVACATHVKAAPNKYHTRRRGHRDSLNIDTPTRSRRRRVEVLTDTARMFPVEYATAVACTVAALPVDWVLVTTPPSSVIITPPV